MGRVREFWSSLTPLGKAVAVALACLNVGLIALGGWHGVGLSVGVDGCVALYVFAGPES